MADATRSEDGGLPPPSEAVHLPGPSYLPVVTAFGIALALSGIVITLVAVTRWIRETRQDISELPLEH